MDLSQGGTVAVFEGGVTELLNIPQAVDDEFAPGDIVEFQLRLSQHVPGLETTVRLLLTPFLGDDGLEVRAPGPILRIRWVRNLGPIAVAAIIVGVAIILVLLTSFVLFKLSPDAAIFAGGFVLLLVGLFVFAFTRRKGRA